MALNKTLYTDFQVTNDFSVKTDVIKTDTDALTLKEKVISLESGSDASIVVGETGMALALAGTTVELSDSQLTLTKGTQQLIVSDAGVEVTKLITSDVQSATGLTIDNDNARKFDTPNIIEEGKVYKYFLTSDVVADAPRFIQYGVLIGDSTTVGHAMLEETVLGGNTGEKVLITQRGPLRDTQLSYNTNMTGMFTETNNTYRFTLTEL